MTIHRPAAHPLFAPEYSAQYLQKDRPQPMYDKSVSRLLDQIFLENPSHNEELVPEFKTTFLNWLKSDKLNYIKGWESEFQTDVCIGCTQFIDDLYQTRGAQNIMTLQGDYLYHWRLNPNLTFFSLDSLSRGKELLIAMPFPSLGDVHPQMDEILSRCLDLKIPVHIDAAWLSCSRDIHFDFSHPAIESFAISLSKGLGLGGNRIALRFSRNRSVGPISIMNDFNMNCQSLLHVGNKFMNTLGANYFWTKYGEAYSQVCRDFNLAPTKAIHLAISADGPVGVRPLLRYLVDR